jgi:hypothetical protein
VKINDRSEIIGKYYDRHSNSAQIFAIVMPVHNEQDNLIYSLKKLGKIEPTEVYFLLDRCSDNSEKIILDWVEKHKETIVWNINKKNDDFPEKWGFRVAALRRLGYADMSVFYDTVLSLDADLVLDPKIGEIIRNNKWDEYPLLRFGFLDYPYNLKSFLRSFFSRFSPFKPYSGLTAFNTKKWIESEDLRSVRKVVKGEDAHLILSFENRGYKTKYIPTKTLHLRTAETEFQDWHRGKNYVEKVNASFLRVLFISIFMLRPMMLKSYLYHRGWMKITRHSIT